jgi:hypothetical protein
VANPAVERAITSVRHFLNSGYAKRQRIAARPSVPKKCVM